MTTEVLLAVLAAAMMHAGWNALIRGAADKGLYTLLLHACSACLAAAGLMVVGLPHVDSWPYLLMSALLHTGYIALLMRAYEGAPLAVSYILMRGTAPLLVCLLSAPLLGEALGLPAAVGAACILLGLGVIAHFGGQSLSAVLRHASGRAALLNASLIAAYTLVDGQGVRLSGSPASYVLALALIEPLGLLCHHYRRRPQQMQAYFAANWKLGLLGAAVSLSGYGIVLWAMTRAPVAMVATVRESSVVFAVLIGALWFKEGRLRAGLMSALMVALGVSLIKH